MKVNTILFLLFFFQLNAQEKLTYQNDVEIYYLGNEVSQKEILAGKSSYNFKIINNTNQTFLIPKFGFENNNYVFENNEFVEPASKFLGAYPADFDLDECRSNIIMLEPQAKIEVPYLNIFSQKSIYKLDNQKAYKLIVISKQYPSNSRLKLQGCERYIEKLEKEGGKFANISIITEISFVH